MDSTVGHLGGAPELCHVIQAAFHLGSTLMGILSGIDKKIMANNRTA